VNESGGISSSSTFLSSDGEGYERQMGRWSRRLAPLFVEFAGIDAARHILDVGCGTGSLAFCLARQPGITQVTGVDLSPVYVAYAKRKYPDARMAFQVGDACDLPFDNASFDHTLSMLVLQFIPQAERAVREMRRVTRRGGVVAAATWDTGGGLLAHRMIFDSAALIDPGGNAARAQAYGRPLSRPDELARLWQAAGLVDVTQDMRTIRMEFASFGDFWAPVEGNEGPVAAYVRTLDAKTAACLRSVVARAYLGGDGDGPRSYAATAWVVKGKVT
jgi:SAM-dependent methyltransferase